MLAQMWSASLAGCGSSSEPELELRAGAAGLGQPNKGFPCWILAELCSFFVLSGRAPLSLQAVSWCLEEKVHHRTLRGDLCHNENPLLLLALFA